MPDFVTTIYLTLMFLALYMFAFFIILTVRNRKDLFSYPEMKTERSVTILIPAYNEQDSIKDTIEHVMNLNYNKKKLEIIVLNDGSTDKTVKIIKELQKKYKNLKLIDKENSGKAKSLNIGVENARGELVAVVDSDSFPDKESLRKMIGYFEDPKMGAVTSFVRVRNYNHNFLAHIQGIEYLILGWTRKLFDFVDSVFVTNGPLSLYRKSFLKKIGGFDPTSITEDIDITWNLLDHGYKTGMCLDASVSTVVPHKIKPWFRQRTRWGVGGFQVIEKFKKSFFKKGMFGLFVLPFVSLSIILSIAIFAFSSYLFFKGFVNQFLTLGYSTSANTAIFALQELNLYPPVMLFYFVVMFSLSLGFTWYILESTEFEGERGILNIKRFFNVLFYMIVYLTLYPIVWFASIYRYLKKDLRW